MSDTMATITPQSVREEFGARELTESHELGTASAIAQASAEVQARYIMAMRRPRDWMTVRTRLLQECKRSGFAQTALYAKPAGGSLIVGFSIRFAEAALRCMTNMMPETRIVHDDARKRTVRVQVSDLENNLTYTSEFAIEKTVERRFPGKGQQVISSRTNTKGEVVYLVQATEADFGNKESSAVSKTIRNLALRMLPSDIQDDCRTQIDATIKQGIDADPARERKALADAFSALGVQPQELQRYLGHPLETVSPAEVVELRQVFQSVKGGETSWHEIVSSKAGDKDDAPEPEAKGRGMAAARKKMESRKVEKTAIPDEEEPPAVEGPVNELGYPIEDEESSGDV